MSAEVKVGQVWADNDWRSEGRRVRVVGVGASYATVEVIAQGHGSYRSMGRRSQIRLDRFRPTSTGYRLVEEATQ